MSGRVMGTLRGVGSVLRDVGSSMRGVIPALRSKDGTYGTQRMHSAQLDEQRRASYPRD